MGRVVLDMRGLIPFGESVEDDRCVNQTGYHGTSKCKNQQEPYKAELQDATYKCDLQQKSKHRYAPPAAPIDEAVPMTFVMLSAMPAAPPKIA